MSRDGAVAAFIYADLFVGGVEGSKALRWLEQVPDASGLAEDGDKRTIGLAHASPAAAISSKSFSAMRSVSCPMHSVDRQERSVATVSDLPLLITA